MINKDVKCYFIAFTGVPDQGNLPMFQRSTYLARHFDMTLYTDKSVEVAKPLIESCLVEYFPLHSVFLHKLKIFGVVFEKIIFTFWVVLKLLFSRGGFIYTREDNGLSAAGILKMLAPRKFKWAADMQHTPYFYYDEAGKKGLPRLKKPVFRILGIIYIIRSRFFLPKADMIVSMSYGPDDGFSVIMKEEFHVPPENIFPVPDGTDLDIIALAKQDTTPCSIPVPADRPLFVYGGAVNSERIELLRRFVDTYRTKVPSASLVFCGPITMEASIYYNSSKTPFFLYAGLIPHSELLRLYKICDAIVAPIDGFMRDYQFSHPGKVFEAMAMEKILIVTPLSSVSKIAKEGKNCIILDINDLSSVCDKVNAAISSEDTKSIFGKNALDSVKFLDWNTINPIWFRNIERMLASEPVEQINWIK